ncbi:hypothetical protein ACP8HI_20410 [Paenibacillus sp. FA6]|uniref:hypothetical protein n=1 Tax=Paenibacillus sp. FA6 TaxID=3413029 RepID=UPI003F65B221
MIESLEVLAEPLIRSRLESLYCNLSKTQSDYKQLSSDCEQYFKLIQESLPHHLQHSIFLYEDAQISLQSILERSIYLQGFKDALYLFNELHTSIN